MMAARKHIDDVMPSTVDEHFDAILKDRTVIDSKFVKVSPKDLPEWFDERLFKIGQVHYTENMVSLGMVHVAGLIAVLAVPDIGEVLRYTNQSSTPCLAFKRMGQTVLHMNTMLRSNILDPESKWFDSVNVVRWKHATTSRKRLRENLSGIYEKDMAITQAAFFSFAYTNPRAVGLTYRTREVQEGSNHFWRVTGYLLGVPDRLNVCRKTAAETTELCKRIVNEVFAKHMNEYTPEFKELAGTTLDGLWYIDFGLDRDALLAYTYKLSGTEYKETLGWYSYLHVKYRDVLFYLCCVPYLGVVLKTYFRYVITIAYWLLENYPILARVAFGEKNSRIHLYPKIL